MKIVNPSVELIWSTPQAETMIELAGRTCYKSEPRVFKDCDNCFGTGLVKEFISDVGEDNGPEGHYVELQCHACNQRSTREFIQKILKSGHHSVLEHGSASLRIITDNGIMREITRHRLFSYSIESTRYCNYSKDKFENGITFIKPSNIKSFSTWELAMVKAEETYLHMIEVGDSPQISRSVLPLCTKCEIVMTGNFRNWRHFLKLRLASNAHPDMIILARKINEVLKNISSIIFDDNY